MSVVGSRGVRLPHMQLIQLLSFKLPMVCLVSPEFTHDHKAIVPLALLIMAIKTINSNCNKKLVAQFYLNNFLNGKNPNV